MAQSLGVLNFMTQKDLFFLGKDNVSYIKILASFTYNTKCVHVIHRNHFFPHFSDHFLKSMFVNKIHELFCSLLKHNLHPIKFNHKPKLSYDPIENLITSACSGHMNFRTDLKNILQCFSI